MKPDLIVSFIGGKTSAYMSYMLKRDYSDQTRFFFRNHRSTEQLLAQAELYNSMMNKQRTIFDLDENGGCTEECQPY